MTRLTLTTALVTLAFPAFAEGTGTLNINGATVGNLRRKQRKTFLQTKKIL